MPRNSFSAAHRLFAVLVGLVSIVALVGCSGGGDGGNAPEASTPDADVQITSANLEFDTDVLEVPAGEAFTLAFTNQEGAPHNVAIYREQGGEDIFVGEVISGPDRTVIYEIPALEAGEYYFQCDVHPDMNGTVVAG